MGDYDILNHLTVPYHDIIHHLLHSTSTVAEIVVDSLPPWPSECKVALLETFFCQATPPLWRNFAQSVAVSTPMVGVHHPRHFLCTPPNSFKYNGLMARGHKHRATTSSMHEIHTTFLPNQNILLFNAHETLPLPLSDGYVFKLSVLCPWTIAIATSITVLTWLHWFSILFNINIHVI